jgi:hypothetical protein
VKSKFDKEKSEKKQLQKWTKTKSGFHTELFLNERKIHVDFDFLFSFFLLSSSG